MSAVGAVLKKFKKMVIKSGLTWSGFWKKNGKSVGSGCDNLAVEKGKWKISSKGHADRYIRVHNGCFTISKHLDCHSEENCKSTVEWLCGFLSAVQKAESESSEYAVRRYLVKKWIRGEEKKKEAKKAARKKSKKTHSIQCPHCKKHFDLNSK